MRKAAFVAVLLCLLFSIASAKTDLNLSDSISAGLKNNEQITAAQEKVNAAQAKVSQALSYFLPSITLSSNYTRSQSSPIMSTFAVGGIPTSVSFGINEASDLKGWEADLRQNIFTFGKLENGILIALDNLEFAKQDLRKAKQDVIYNVGSSYFNAIKARELLKLSQDSLNMAKAHFDQVKAMQEQGILAKNDVLRSEVAKISAEHNLIKAKNASEITASILNSAIGNRIDEPIDLKSLEFESLNDKLPYTHSELLKKAFENRPDIKQIKIAGSISDKNLGMAKAGMLPSITAQASYGWRNTNYPVSAVNYDATSWAITGAASWNLFDGFNIQSKIKEADAQYRETLANKKALEKAIELDVKQAYLEFSAAKEMIKSSLKEVESAAENYNLSETRFKNGLGTNIDVLDAQTALTQAKSNLLSSQFDLALSVSKIEKAIGLSDLSKADIEKQDRVYLEGSLKYILLEGGFMGFIDKDGKKYDLYGAKSKELFEKISRDGKEYKARIWGRFKKDAVTIHMWGKAFELEGYEWK